MSSKNVGLVSFLNAKVEAGVKAALSKRPEEVREMISASGLRGRGGAGFPAGMKWGFAAEAKNDQKYVVCNSDEGEPGTFKDREIIKQCADLLLEGMTIAAYAIGAQRGFIYLRGEYAFLQESLMRAIERRRDENLLGSAIMGRDGFNFDIELRMGAGAYVCGEETAMIESLEGHRGEPRNRPPFPVDTGYFGSPTVVQNVETLCWVPLIMAKGPSWFKKAGTERSAGLKILSISGDCEFPGAYEFPFGVTLREVLKEVGGLDAKAVQVGGASGVCVPAEHFDRRIAFEDLSTGGSIIIFGPHRDMLDVAENFLAFFVEESCGQCTPCREGNGKLLEGVRLLKAGRCSMAYLKELCSLGETMQLASKCGLGQSSPNAFLSIVEQFQDEIMGRSEGV